MNAGADPARSNYDLMLRPQFIGCRSLICSTVYTGGPTSPSSPGALFTTISLRGPERRRARLSQQEGVSTGREMPSRLHLIWPACATGAIIGRRLSRRSQCSSVVRRQKHFWGGCRDESVRNKKARKDLNRA